MRNLTIVSFMAVIFLSAYTSKDLPDLSKKEDLKALGTGKIVEKDRSVITRIILEEVNENAVVYIKNESMHDIAIDQIARIEFRETKWGPLKIEFPNNKPRITKLEE